MTAFYRFQIDKGLTRIAITMGGFFTPTDVRDFKNEFTAALRSQAWGYGRHTAVCDIRQMGIQAQTVVSLFSDVVNEPSLRSRRLAFIVGSSLARMQAQRLTNREGVSFFTNEEGALNWLNRQ